MPVIRASVDLPVAAETAWCAITDWVAQGSWMPLTDVRVTAPAAGAGTELVARTSLGPVGFDDPMTVDVWQPPYRCEVAHHGCVVPGRGVFAVLALPGGRSRLTWEEHVSGPAALELAARVTGPVTRVFLALALRRFAREVRTGRLPR